MINVKFLISNISLLGRPCIHLILKLMFNKWLSCWQQHVAKQYNVILITLISMIRFNKTPARIKGEWNHLATQDHLIDRMLVSLLMWIYNKYGRCIWNMASLTWSIMPSQFLPNLMVFHKTLRGYLVSFPKLVSFLVFSFCFWFPKFLRYRLVVQFWYFSKSWNSENLFDTVNFKQFPMNKNNYNKEVIYKFKINIKSYI